MSRSRTTRPDGSRTDAEALERGSELEAMDVVALSADPLAPKRGLRERVLGSTTYGGRVDAYVDRAATFFDIDNELARQLLASALDPSGADWFDDPTPNTRIRLFPGGPKLKGAHCMLVHMEKGVAYPPHLHLGDEWCLFLGGRIVEPGRELNPGDLVVNPAGSRHAVQHAVDDEPTVFGIVVYEGVRFDDR